MQRDRPVVLSIAGYDPSGGAGVLADMKTMEQLHVQGMAVLTASTIQTEDEFIQLEWLPLEFLLESISILLVRYPVRVVKIGVVRNAGFLQAIIEGVRNCSKDIIIVWDPVLVSSSGYTFFSKKDIKILESLATKIDLITPNYNEYLTLCASLDLEGYKNVLVKGGHRKNMLGTDVLIQSKTETAFLPTRKVLFEKHGSGCVLSSAIAAYLARGKTMKEACWCGKQYIEQFLNSSPSLLGKHNGIQ